MDANRRVEVFGLERELVGVFSIFDVAPSKQKLVNAKLICASDYLRNVRLVALLAVVNSLVALV